MGETRLIGGRFELGVLIGQGGMGDVYHGRDTQTGQTVAIKSLRPDVTTNSLELVERFEREGEALRKLDHPNIVKMLAAIQQDGHHYLVMEYVGSGSLKELLEETPRLPVKRVLEIALDLSDALIRAHRLKIIHRDLKPANVLLAEDGTPRLTDFGVAQMGDLSHVTESGALIGTYAYMSPEGCMGGELDVRADIWSFGVMLYEMLAGRRPFEGTQPAAVITAILQKPTPNLLELRPDVPVLLANLVYAMLEKEPSARMSSARLVGAEVEAFLKGSDSALFNLSKTITDIDKTPTTKPIFPDRVLLSDDASTVADIPTPRHAFVPPPRKVVFGAPRIFISYRRADSIAVTGRLYDRLVQAFGESYIFKDVNKIPLGANFKSILEEEVESCDVLLAIIGDEWLYVTDDNNHRRLDNPDDFVRIEVKVALDRENDTLLIPVLVNNALMPSTAELPDDLDELAFRNAAVVRNDPDFNTDVQRLIEEIKGHFSIQPSRPVQRATRVRWAAIAGLLVVLAGLLFWTLRPPSGSNDSVTLPPPEAGKYRVLVAEIPGGSGATSAVVIDLTQHLTNDIPFMNVEVKRYDGTISDDAHAQTVATANHAALIIWGSSTGDAAELQIQAGSLAELPYNVFSLQEVQQVVNVRFRITDVHTESAATAVLGALQAFVSCGGKVIDIARNAAAAPLISAKSGAFVGNGLAVRLNRAFNLFATGDVQAALDEADQAVTLNPRVPVLYLYRSLIRQKAGDLDSARDDLETGREIGPSGWMMPPLSLGASAIYLRNQPLDAITWFTDVLAEQPDFVDGYTLRSIAYYVAGQYDEAGSDAQKAIDLGSEFNFPYLVAGLVSLRHGNLSEAQSLVKTVLLHFPDPTAGERVLNAAYGNAFVSSVLPALVEAFGNLTLRQWGEIVTTATNAEAGNIQSAELYFMKGFAYCNLKDYPNAEAAYTQGLTLEPDWPLMHGLRAEVRFKQQNLAGALEDARTITSSSQADVLSPYVPLLQSGALNCENFLTYDFGSLTTAPSKAAATLQPTPEVTVEPTIEPTADTASVHEYRILVADFEPLGESRDVARFIARDLSDKLERDVPFSQLRVERYNGVIVDADQAREIAEQENASIILWGNYGSGLVQVEVQLGSLADFPNIPYSRALLERTVNVTLNLNNERTESTVTAVLGILGVLHMADGNGFESLRTQAILDQIGAVAPGAASTGVSANVYRYQTYFITNTERSIAEMDAAIQVDSGNPLLYGLRGAVRVRVGRFADARRDADSLERLSPAGAIFPWYLRVSIPFITGDTAAAIALYDQIIALRPDDWFPYNMRAYINYLAGNYDAAKADYAESIARHPNMNFPYVVSALLALREGRMIDALSDFDTILREFPDPSFASRVINAYMGDQAAQTVTGPLFAAVGNFVLKQYDQMLTNTQAAIAIQPDLLDLYALEGFAQCNLGDYAAAEAAYTSYIDQNPNVPLLYVMRGDVRLKLANLGGALEDSNQARTLITESGQGEELLPYIDAGIRLQVNCTNFFEWKPS